MIRIALHDLRQTFTDRAALIWLAVLPVVFAGFFGVVIGGGSDPTTVSATLTLVDRDGGPVALDLIAGLEGEGLELNIVSEAELKDLENPYRTLFIPEDFSNRVLSGTQVVLKLEKEPNTSQEAAVLAQARIVRAITRTIARLIEAASVQDDSQDTDEPIDPANFEAVPPRPDLVLIDSSYAGAAKIMPSGFSQSIPGNAVMFVMLVALTYGAGSLTGERQSGLLRRLATTPLSPGEIIVGKILGRAAVAGAQVTILVGVAIIANLFFGIEIGNAFNVWIVLLIYTLCVAPLGIVFGAYFEDPDRASSIGVITTMVMASLGGCWWPLEVVPAGLQKAALIFPTTWAMKALHGVISFGRGLDELLIPLAVLVGFAAILTAIAVRSLRID